MGAGSGAPLPSWAGPVPYPCFFWPFRILVWESWMQGLLLVLNSNCPNITFYQGSLEATQLTPSHLILLVILWSNNIVTLTLQKRKPEFREVQIRARIWTQIFSFKSGLLLFEHHHCENLPFAQKESTNVQGQLSRRQCREISTPTLYILPSGFPSWSFLHSFFFLGSIFPLCRWPFTFTPFQCSFILSWHRLGGSAVLSVVWYWVRQPVINRWTQPTSVVKGGGGDGYMPQTTKQVQVWEMHRKVCFDPWPQRRDPNNDSIHLGLNCDFLLLGTSGKQKSGWIKKKNNNWKRAHA